MLTARQRAARAQAEAMAEERAAEKATKKAEAEAWQAFKAAGGTLLTPEQLTGFLIPLLNAEKHKDAWERDGKAHLARLAAEAAKPKQLVEITFADGSKGPKSAAEMRTRDLYWSKPRNCWEGQMNLDDAKALARSIGGTLKIDGPDGLAMAAE
jgi:hypothetical protein